MKVVCTVTGELYDTKEPIKIESYKDGMVVVVVNDKRYHVKGEELKTAVDKCLG